MIVVLEEANTWKAVGKALWLNGSLKHQICFQERRGIDETDS